MTDTERNAAELAETQRVMRQVQQRLEEAFAAGWKAHARHWLALTPETACQRWMRETGIAKVRVDE